MGGRRSREVMNRQNVTIEDDNCLPLNPYYKRVMAFPLVHGKLTCEIEGWPTGDEVETVRKVMELFLDQVAAESNARAWATSPDRIDTSTPIRVAEHASGAKAE